MAFFDPEDTVAAPQPTADAQQPTAGGGFFDPSDVVSNKDAADILNKKPDYDPITHGAQAQQIGDDTQNDLAFEAYKQQQRKGFWGRFTPEKTMHAIGGFAGGLWNIAKEGIPKAIGNIGTLAKDYGQDIYRQQMGAGQYDPHLDDNTSEEQAAASELGAAAVGAGKALAIDLPYAVWRNASDLKNWVTGKQWSDEELRDRYNHMTAVHGATQGINAAGGFLGDDAISPQQRAEQKFPTTGNETPEQLQQIQQQRAEEQAKIEQSIGSQSGAMQFGLTPTAVFDNPAVNAVGGIGLRAAGGAVGLAGKVLSKGGHMGVGALGTMYELFHGEPLTAIGVTAARYGAKPLSNLLTDAGDSMITKSGIPGGIMRQGAGRVAQGVASGTVAGGMYALGASDPNEAIGSIIGGGLTAPAFMLEGALNRGGMRARAAEDQAKAAAANEQKFGVLRQVGEQVARTQPGHQDGMDSLPKDEQDRINYTQGFLYGRQNKLGQQVEVNVLPEAEYLQVPGGRQDTRGFVSSVDGNIYLNAGARQSAADTLGHETGHVAERLSEIVGSDISVNLQRSIAANLYAGGKPTPEFQQFIKDYDKALGAKRTPEQMASEFIAETTRKILQGEPIESFSEDPGIGTKIRRGVSDLFKTMGLFPKAADGTFSWREVPAITARVRDMLHEIGSGAKERAETGLKQAAQNAQNPVQPPQGGASGAPQAPTPTAAAPTPVSPREAVGINPAEVEAMKKRAADDAEAQVLRARGLEEPREGEPTPGDFAIQPEEEQILRSQGWNDHEIENMPLHQVESIVSKAKAYEEANQAGTPTNQSGGAGVQVSEAPRVPPVATPPARPGVPETDQVDLARAAAGKDATMRGIIDTLDNNRGKVVWVKDYNSAEKTQPGFGERGRADEIKEQGAGKRKKGETGTYQDKPFIPTEIRVNAKGEPYVNGFDVDVLLSNMRHITDYMRENKIDTPLKSDAEIEKALQTYNYNHNNGFDGAGTKRLEQPGPDYRLPKANPDAEPIPLDPDPAKAQRIADMINMAVNSRPDDIGGKEAGKAVALKMENQGFRYGTETNALRSELENHGFDSDKLLSKRSAFYGRLSTDLIKGGVSTEPPNREGKSVRPHGFDIDLGKAFQHGKPQFEAVAAGYMPSTETSSIKSKSEEERPSDLSSFMPGEVDQKARPSYIAPDEEDHVGNLERAIESTKTNLGRVASSIPAERRDSEAIDQSVKDGSVRQIDRGTLQSDIDAGRLGKNIGRNEHDVYHDPASGRALKITKEAGKFGVVDAGVVGESLTPYLERLKLINELVDDDLRFEGVVQDENGKYRAVVSQPWIVGKRATPEQIAEFFENKGYKQFGPTSWFHPGKELTINDAEGVNVIHGDDGKTYPIDVIPKTDLSERRINGIQMLVDAYDAQKKAAIPEGPSKITKDILNGLFMPKGGEEDELTAFRRQMAQKYGVGSTAPMNDSEKSKLAQLQAENGSIDPITNRRTLIPGSRLTPEQSKAAATALTSHYRNFDAALKKAVASGSDEDFEQVEKTLPKVSLADIGLRVNDKGTAFVGNDEGLAKGIKRVGGGGESVTYAYPGDDVAYKVFFPRRNIMTGLPEGIGIQGTMEKRVNGEWFVNNEPGSLRSTLEKLYVLSKTGGVPSEVVGATDGGSLIVKQPYYQERPQGAEPMRKAHSAAQLESPNEAVLAEGKIGDNSDVDKLAVVDGQPYIISDLKPGNYAGDNQGNVRLADPIVAQVPKRLLRESPALKAQFDKLTEEENRDRANVAYMPKSLTADEETQVDGLRKQIDSLFYKRPKTDEDEKQIEALRQQRDAIFEQAALRGQNDDQAQAKAADGGGEENVPGSAPAGAPPDAIPYAHWSRAGGLDTLDPSKHGTGIPGEEGKRRRDYKDRYVDRTYLGVDDYQREPNLPKNKYTGSLDKSLIYDLADDPMDLKSLAADAVKADPDKNYRTELERLVKEHGLLGYKAGNVVAVFHKIPAGGHVGPEQFAQSAPDYARRSPDMMRTLRDMVPHFDSIEDRYFQQKPADQKQVSLQNGIAKNYDQLKLDNSSDPKVQRANQALIDKLGDQYDQVLKGVDVEPWADKQADGTWKPRNGQPYKNSGEMQEDMRKNKHLYFFTTTPEQYGSSGKAAKNDPFLEDSGKVSKGGYNLLNNDVLRAVHDAIAHGSFGVQFGPSGEEAAWRAHMATVDDPWARWALTTATRGQNSWVNYRDAMLNSDGMPKKKGDPGYLPPERRPFADQKVDLIDPKYVLTGDREVDKAVTTNPEFRAAAGLPDTIRDRAGQYMPKSRPEEEPEDTSSIKSKSTDLSSFMPSGKQDQSGALADVDKLGFYSGLGRLTQSDKIPNRASGEQMLNTLKSQGAKQEEMDWMGLPEFLKTHDGPVTKQELQDFVKQGGIKLQEVRKGYENPPTPEDHQFLLDEVESESPAYLDRAREVLDRLDEGDDPKDVLHDLERVGASSEALEPFRRFLKTQTKYEKYVVPGGMNYKEVLLTLPDKSRPSNPPEGYEVKPSQYEGLWDVYKDGQKVNGAIAGKQRATDWAWNKESPATPFKSNHWDQPNVLAHIRQADHTDTEGNKVRLIEELQSDWHQKGRASGYKGASLPPEYKVEQRENGAWRVLDGTGSAVSDWFANREDAIKGVAEDLGTNGVPNAPFKKTWAEVAFKRALRMAVDDNMDSIAWTKGETQAQRYDLSKQVDKITWNPETHKLDAEKDGANVITEKVAPNELAGAIGKDAAKLLLTKSGIAKPNSTRELAENVLGREMAASVPLEHVDSGMLAALQNDKVAKAVIPFIPADVVDILKAAQSTPKQFLSDPEMVASRLSEDARSKVGVGIVDAIRETGALIRAKLRGLQSGGNDLELLPALSASDLNSREVSGLLDDKSLFHSGSSPTIKEERASTTPGAEPLPGKSGPIGASDVSAAEFARLTKAHADILGSDEGIVKQEPVSISGPELNVNSSGMRGFYDKILPDFVRKYVKKWGGKVDTTDLVATDHGDAAWRIYVGGEPTASHYATRENAERASRGYEGDIEVKNEGATPVHSVEITPEMRRAIKEGQALYMPSGEGDQAASEDQGGLSSFQPQADQEDSTSIKSKSDLSDFMPTSRRQREMEEGLKQSGLQEFDLGKQFTPQALSQQAVKRRTLKAQDAFPEAIPPTYKKEDGKYILGDDGKPTAEKLDYNLSDTPLAKQAAKGIRGTPARQEAMARAFADKLVEEYNRVSDRDDIMSGKDWYELARGKIKEHFGKDALLFAQLLGATSARTPAGENFVQALDAYNQLKAGNYHGMAEKYLDLENKLENGDDIRFRNSYPTQGIQAGEKVTPLNFRYYLDSEGLLPLKSNGKKFNANSLQVLRVLAGNWESKVGGPKTPNFARNLSGEGENPFESTIDVWAARGLHRLGNKGLTDKRWRITPESEQGVKDDDFRLGQAAYREAANRIGIQPDALQGVLWFAEKDYWAKKGWGRGGTGSEFSDFNHYLDRIKTVNNRKVLEKIADPQQSLF